MKVLLIGNGGREHALAWKLSASPRVTALFVAPGNPGTAQVADNVEMDITKPADVIRFIKINAIDLVVIGPENPLADGLTDKLSAEGVKVFGPTKAGAQIESDKWFAKELMKHQSVPTAEARSFTDPKVAEEFVKARNQPCVVKATGLAMGKGVTVCHRISDALEAIDRVMRRKDFGAAGERVVIEEMLIGPEVSIFALVSGRSIYVMETAQDHKAVDDGDTGPMTGGMGAYSPTTIVSDAMLRQIERDILVPTIDGLVREGIEYKGVIFAGLMITNNGPKVLEFNCRFGDPETQPLMMRLQSDVLDMMLAVTDGKLDQLDLKWDPRPAVTVVATSKGYPGKYPTKLPITGVDNADSMPDVKVFHSGTTKYNGQLVTNGGRVLGVTALGNSVADAQKKAYRAMDEIKFEGMHFRKDIGRQGI